MNFLKGRLESANGTPHFASGQLKVKVGDAARASLEPYAGREIIFGIRPEDIVYGGGDRPEEQRAKVTVEVVEPMGSETWLYFGTEGQTVIARVGGHSVPRMGEDVVVGFDMDRARFFDPETENVVN
jgi:multiple sugar transport system ATP-binding protein